MDATAWTVVGAAIANRHRCPVRAARTRRDHELLLRHQSCRRVAPSASRRPRTASTVLSPTPTTRVP